MDILISRNGDQHGPYPEATARQFLEEGKLLPTDSAWHAGADGWKPLSEVLGAAAQPPAAASPPKPPGGGILKRTLAGAAPAETEPAKGEAESSEAEDPNKIRVTRKGEAIGPYSRDKAKEYFAAGQLLPTDWGWHDGMDEWKPLYEVLGMEVPAQSAFAPAAARGKPGKGKKVALIIGIVVLVAGLAAAGYFFLYPMLKGDSGGRKLTAEEQKVVGEYQYNARRGPFTSVSCKAVLLDNGVYEEYENGKKMWQEKQDGEYKWSIVNGEIHVEMTNENTGLEGHPDFDDKARAELEQAGLIPEPTKIIYIWTINKDKSITYIALIEYGRRFECTHYANQMGNKFIKTYTKIK